MRRLKKGERGKIERKKIQSPNRRHRVTIIAPEAKEVIASHVEEARPAIAGHRTSYISAGMCRRAWIPWLRLKWDSFRCQEHDAAIGDMSRLFSV